MNMATNKHIHRHMYTYTSINILIMIKTTVIRVKLLLRITNFIYTRVFYLTKSPSLEKANCEPSSVNGSAKETRLKYIRFKLKLNS